MGTGTRTSMCHSIARVWFSTGTCKVGRAHAFPLGVYTTGVWAWPPVGPAAFSHFTPRLGSKLTFSTGLAMLLFKTNTFLERLLQLTLQDLQDINACTSQSAFM